MLSEITKIIIVTKTFEIVIHYLKNKVGVVDFANAQGPEGPAGFEILPLRGLL